jgi:PPOX class probable F420-dependent enzyme
MTVPLAVVTTGGVPSMWSRSDSARAGGTPSLPAISLAVMGLPVAWLSTEPVIWLGTTGPDAHPHHVPVWFCWHDPEALIFSMPATQKVRNLRSNPQAALTLDSAAGGQDIVLAEGRARVGAARAVEQIAPLFASKYAAVLGSEPGLEQWRSTFSVPVLVTVSRIVAWTRQDGQLQYRSVP